MRSDLEHRDEVVLDQLTGMLNRKALDRRVAELEQQSTVTGDPVAVIIGDLDRFKEVNDTHGHAPATPSFATSPTRSASGCAPSTSRTGSAARSS